MLNYELNRADGILIITPLGPLQSTDFEKLVREVDPYISQNGKLNGLMIYTRSFPGWDNFAAFLSHMRFVKNHHQKVRKIAAVTGSGFLSIMPEVANHFVDAEIRHFDYADKDAALNWLKAAGENDEAPERRQQLGMQRVSTCLWFDDQAQTAAAFYVSLFPNSRILDTKYYLDDAPRPAGSVLTVQFTLDGTEYLALNGGPHFQFSPAVSVVAYCDTQEEVDTLWRKLCEGGKEGQCGWLTDRYGVSWQVIPRAFLKLVNTADVAASKRAFAAMMKMTKLDMAALNRAYQGS